MGILNVDGKSHIMRHVMIPWFLNTPKNYAFEETLKMCLIDSIP